MRKPIVASSGVFTWPLIALIALLTLSPGCGDTSNNSDGLGGGNQAACIKDRDALALLLAQPQACVASETCPTGSHCSDANFCDWQCIADSDCGSGYDCTCDGRCVVEGTEPPDGGVPTDPSCPRVRELLLTSSIAVRTCQLDADCPGDSFCDAATGKCASTTVRTCTLDEECPLGSYCDAATAKCSYECLATSDAEAPCTVGTVCDCFGRCVPPSGEAIDVDLVRPSLTLEPFDVAVASAAFGQKTFDVVLTADTKPARAPVVNVRAPQGLRVAKTAGGPMLQEVTHTFADSAWQTIDGQQVARVTIYYDATATLPTATPPWWIDVSGDHIANPQRLMIHPDAPTTTPTSGIYAGVVTAQVDGASMLTQVPVVAWASPTFVLFFDRSRVLSPSGLVGVSLSGPGATAKWVDAVNGSQMSVEVATKTAPVSDASGNRSGGAFTVKMPYLTSQPLTFAYDLTWTGFLAAPSCTADANCATGSYCETGLNRCVEGTNWRVSGAPTNGLTSPAADQWAAASAWFLSTDTPSLFGSPSLTGFGGLPRTLMCLPPATVAGTGPELTGFARPVTAMPVSGEACSQAIPLISTRDRAQTSTPPSILNAAELLDACLAESKKAPPTVGSSSTANANAWFSNATSCVSLARLYPMVHALTGWTGPTLHRGGTDARLLHDVLSRWMATQSFFATEAVAATAAEGALALAAPEVGDVRFDQVAARIESELNLLLRGRTTDALVTLPRYVLRSPDYRGMRPVSWYSFDAAERNGTKVLDVIGEAHTTLPSSTFTSTANNVTTTQVMPIPRGPAEIYGDYTISFWFQVPSISSGQTKSLLEYGDATNLLYQIALKNTGSGPVLQLYSGSRTTQTPPPLTVSNVIGNGMPHHVVVSRRATTYASGTPLPTITWEYKVWVDGTFFGPYTQNHQMPLTLNAASAGGSFSMWGLADELAIFDDSIVYGAGGSGGYSGALYVATTAINQRDKALADIATYEGLPTTADHEQTVGLSAIMMETGAQYLTTVKATIERELGQSFSGCTGGIGASTKREEAIAMAGRAARYAWAVEALALRMHDRGTEVGCSSANACAVTTDTCSNNSVGEAVCKTNGAPRVLSLAWEDRYIHARAELDAARSGLVNVLQPIATCNTANLEAMEPLPLFFGDATGNSARFFAASDYVLHTWAEPAVTRAANSLEAARSAWLSKRASEIQELQNQQDRDRRLEQITTSYAQPIIDACGLVDVDPIEVLDLVSSGQVDLDTCYRIRSSLCDSPAHETDAACFRGDLGASALGIIAAQQDIDSARLRASIAVSQYFDSSLYCSEWQDRVSMDTAAVREHDARMASLRKKEAQCNRAATFCSALTQAIANPYTAGAAIGSLAAGLNAEDVRLEMANAESEFQSHLQVRSWEEQINRCFFEADQLAYSIRIASDEISRRATDVQLALLHMNEVQRRAQEAWTAARSILRREQNRTLPSIAHDFWLDDRIDRYQRDFAWAKRLTYLAARAVEYEFQQSLAVTNEVLRATSPDELQNTVIALQQEQAGRSINGRRPEDTSVVLSLRDDILQLGGRDDAQPGERDWSASTRFGERLRSPWMAIYDGAGDYLGQGVSFTLREDGALAYRCAERVWRVNATIQGDIVGVTSPSVPVMLLKRNTFASQWCDGRGDGSALQMGTIAQSVNLFHPESGWLTDGEASSFTAALMFPWFNVIRSEFFRDQYVEGSSEEFAGRGLYGDYILLFPDSGLLEWSDGDPSNDFALGRVEDVLIRFDLLSVDDLSL
jgi:hypothetical protein